MCIKWFIEVYIYKKIFLINELVLFSNLLFTNNEYNFVFVVFVYK